ncbi:MAG: hypothetical protein NVS2B9_12790 [Myxococcales bacterium]
MAETRIKTSDDRWLERLARAYKERAPVSLIDDANVGIDPAEQTLFQLARTARMSPRELAGAAVALGMSAAGAGMVLLAFIDPEPTSKLGLLIGGGLACVLGGGFSAIRVLTREKPPNVRVTPRGFEIDWR